MMVPQNLFPDSSVPFAPHRILYTSQSTSLLFNPDYKNSGAVEKVKMLW